MAATLTETCAYCKNAITSCPAGAGAGHHCLTAQGWYRATSGRRNWWCPVCAEGCWRAPKPEWLDDRCCHHDELKRRVHAADEGAAQRARGCAADPPEPPPAARDTVINDILVEFEAMSVRLRELTRMLREELIRQQREGDAESEAVILFEENDPASRQGDTRTGRRTQ